MYQPMHRAPRDGSVIVLTTAHGEVRAKYVDCEWMREGDLAESITDCWRPVEPDSPFADGDIEFKEALGWREDK